MATHLRDLKKGDTMFITNAEWSPTEDDLYLTTIKSVKTKNNITTIKVQLPEYFKGYNCASTFVGYYLSTIASGTHNFFICTNDYHQKLLKIKREKIDVYCKDSILATKTLEAMFVVSKFIKQSMGEH